jgi:hypothetical protein
MRRTRAAPRSHRHPQQLANSILLRLDCKPPRGKKYDRRVGATHVNQRANTVVTPRDRDPSMQVDMVELAMLTSESHSCSLYNLDARASSMSAVSLGLLSVFAAIGDA